MTKLCKVCGKELHKIYLDASVDIHLNCQQLKKELSKQQAIKEIEKLTGYKKSDSSLYWNENVFIKEEINMKRVCDKSGNWVEKWDYTDTHYIHIYNENNINFTSFHKREEYSKSFATSIQLNWFEPLSRLIPILFKEGE